MSSGLLPSCKELVVGLQHPGSSATKMLDEMPPRVDVLESKAVEPSSDEELNVHLPGPCVVIFYCEGDDAPTQPGRTPTMGSGHVVFVGMLGKIPWEENHSSNNLSPEDNKLQERLSWEHLPVWLQPELVTCSSIKIVVRCTAKDGPASRWCAHEPPWWEWLSVTCDVPNCDILNLTLDCCFLQHAIILERNQDIRGIDDNGWPAVDGEISDAH